MILIKLNIGLTEVEAHADKDDKAEPGIEVSDEVEDRNDDIGDGWEDAEHYVAVGEEKKEIVESIFSSNSTRRIQFQENMGPEKTILVLLHNWNSAKLPNSPVSFLAFECMFVGT